MFLGQNLIHITAKDYEAANAMIDAFHIKIGPDRARWVNSIYISFSKGQAGMKATKDHEQLQRLVNKAKKLFVDVDCMVETNVMQVSTKIRKQINHTVHTGEPARAGVLKAAEAEEHFSKNMK